MSNREDGPSGRAGPGGPTPPTPVVALRDVIPTAKHAMTLFDMVVDLLGDRAWVQSSGGRARRSLFVRAADDGSFIVPWPLLEVGFSEEAANDEREREAEAPYTPPPEPFEPGVPFRIDFSSMHAVPGNARLHDGPHQLCVNYGASGRWKDMAPSADPAAFAALLPALARGTSSRLELLAEYVASLDVARHGPARVLCRVPRPGGIEGMFLAGRAAIREALFAGRVPKDACFAVADGCVGTALAFGPTREAALAAWRTEVERVRPAPPPRPDLSAFVKPTESFEPTQWTGDDAPPEVHHVFLTARGWDAPPLDPSPAATPAVVVPIAALPAGTPPEGDYTRWLGEYGATNVAVRVHTADGYVLVGEGLRGRFPLDTVDATLLASDRAHPRLVHPETLASPGAGAHTTEVTTYRCFAEVTNAPIEPRAFEWRTMPAFPASGFDGDWLRWALVRVTSLE